MCRGLPCIENINTTTRTTRTTRIKNQKKDKTNWIASIPIVHLQEYFCSRPIVKSHTCQSPASPTGLRSHLLRRSPLAKIPPFPSVSRSLLLLFSARRVLFCPFLLFWNVLMIVFPPVTLLMALDVWNELISDEPLQRLPTLFFDEHQPIDSLISKGHIPYLEHSNTREKQNNPLFWHLVYTFGFDNCLRLRFCFSIFAINALSVSK